MSKRYIDANLLLAQCRRNPLFEKTEKDKGMFYIERSIIDNTPTADVVEVRHGEWGFDGLGWTCSECGEYALTNKSKVQVHSTYCPHCGAKMDGERREE